MLRPARSTDRSRITVNCAGIVTGKRTVRRNRDTGAMVPHDLATFSKVVTINLIGTFNVAAQSAAGMAALDPLGGDDSERGVIVTDILDRRRGGPNRTSRLCRLQRGCHGGMTLPLARDLAPSGIRVVSILPGLFDTPMFAGLPEEGRKALASAVPFPSRLGRVEEYAMLVRTICENPMLNGVSIRLDGAAPG